jgi:hypothetical protein
MQTEVVADTSEVLAEYTNPNGQHIRVMAPPKEAFGLTPAEHMDASTPIPVAERPTPVAYRTPHPSQYPHWQALPPAEQARREARWRRDNEGYFEEEDSDAN